MSDAVNMGSDAANMGEQRSSNSVRRIDALPEGSRLLHIGLMKTGTTGLQQSAAAQREALLAHGVRYPGSAVNHRRGVTALMNRPIGWKESAVVPSMHLWRSLLDEVEADAQRRIWISHEFASECDDAGAQRFSDALGPRLHVVVTLRGFAALLPSVWQQYVKGGYRQPLDWWTRRVLADPPKLKTTPNFHHRHDQSAIVHRWASIVGCENVTVVIADKAQPQLLTDSFEDLLNLPRGFLDGTERGGLQANRSMSLPEAELLRQLNRVIRDKVEWQAYENLIRNGAVARLLESRTPAPDEARLQLSDWAAARAGRRARQYADGIEASGVRIVGELSSLYAPVPSVPAQSSVPDVPLEVAAEMMVGLVSAATGQGGFFDLQYPAPRSRIGRSIAESSAGRRWVKADRITSGVGTGDLLALAGIRGLRRLRSLRRG